MAAKERSGGGTREGVRGEEWAGMSEISCPSLLKSNQPFKAREGMFNRVLATLNPTLDRTRGGIKRRCIRGSLWGGKKGSSLEVIDPILGLGERWILLCQRWVMAGVQSIADVRKGRSSPTGDEFQAGY